MERTMSHPVFGRRQFLGTAALAGLGLGQSPVLTARDALPARKPVRACVLIFYYGGPSHLDTYDPKPDAPAEIRGEFRSVATSVPGTRICEHLPRMAGLMHKVALVRGVHHQARLHDSASIHA